MNDPVDCIDVSYVCLSLQAGSRVQCAGRAVNSNGDEGLELSSSIVSISIENGMCQPRVVGTVGAEPFSAKLRYTGAEDPDHPNLIKITVTMPHIDGEEYRDFSFLSISLSLLLYF